MDVGLAIRTVPIVVFWVVAPYSLVGAYCFDLGDALHYGNIFRPSNMLYIFTYLALKGWMIGNELERICKEASWTNPGIFPRGTRKPQKTLSGYGMTSERRTFRLRNSAMRVLGTQCVYRVT